MNVPITASFCYQSQLSLCTSTQSASFLHTNPFSNGDCPTPTSTYHSNLSSQSSVSSVNGQDKKPADLSVITSKNINSAYCHHIVIDCSSMCFVDTVGSKVLAQVCSCQNFFHNMRMPKIQKKNFTI